MFAHRASGSAGDKAACLKSIVAVFYPDNPTVRLPGAKPHVLLHALQIFDCSCLCVDARWQEDSAADPCKDEGTRCS